MRELIKEDNFVFTKIYNQLEQMDFDDFICSPLINGGCGLGKTTALVDDRMYELFARKLGKAEPQILVIESRSATRDQQIIRNCNPNYHFLQFKTASNIDLQKYDIIIIDEAHSLFTDSEFAADAVSPLSAWLKDNLCFQIFITASDIEFIQFAEKFFGKDKIFNLTFPDLNEAHCRYTAERMLLSVSTKKVSRVLERVEDRYFKEGNKGLIFVWKATDALEMYHTYLEKGYKCGFYISQSNSSKLVKKENKKEEDPEDFEDYCSRQITTDVLSYYKLLDKNRINAGMPAMRDCLLKGQFPPDVDYLFITDVGQEGLSLFDVNLNFIFIEDTYPLTINQKLFRYRNNVAEVFIHLPQRRIQNALRTSLEKIKKLQNEPQDYLRAIYESKTHKYNNKVWFDRKDGKYKVSENYVIYLEQRYAELLVLNSNLKNEGFLKDYYGVYADKVEVINDFEEEQKTILRNFFKDKNGVLLTSNLREEYCEELKELGFCDKQYKKDYTFDYVVKRCREYEICDFKGTRASKKDCQDNPDLEYRKQYQKIIL